MATVWSTRPQMRKAKARGNPPSPIQLMETNACPVTAPAQEDRGHQNEEDQHHAALRAQVARLTQAGQQ